MKQLISILFAATLWLSAPAYAEEAAVSAEAQVETEGNFFSRSWASIKGFFGADEPEPAPEPEKAAPAKEESLVDKAADSTKAGVDWTADKAKQGAEWTKDTAKDVTKAAGKGIKKAGAAIEGLFPTANDTQVDIEASADAELDTE